MVVSALERPPLPPASAVAEVSAGASFNPRTVPLDAPISAAVLVRCIIVEQTPHGPHEQATDEWQVLDANCDLAKMRQVAADFAREHPGHEAVVMIYADHCSAALAVNWGRPAVRA